MFITLSVFPLRLQSGVNLQVCFVNDSSSDKDSDAEDSRTETSLDTPLSPVVCMVSVVCVFAYVLVCVCVVPLLSLLFCENDTGCCIINVTYTSSLEQTELIVVGPRHSRGRLGPVRWLWRVLAGAAEAAGGSPGGTGSGSTYGAHAGGGGEANPAAQTFTCGWLG